MTDISTLSDEELRRKVAELLGWNGVRKGNSPFTEGCSYGIKPGNEVTTRIPAYCTDLNAAITLCDLLAEKGWKSELYRSVKISRCLFRRDNKAVEVESKSLARAICEAAIQALGEKEAT